MTIFDHFGLASLGDERNCRAPSPPTKESSSAFASPKAGETTNFGPSVARRLEESREALSWLLGRRIEVPILTASTTPFSRVAGATSRLASPHSNISSTSTNPKVSCTPFLAMASASSEKITSTPSLPLSGPDLRPLLMSRPRRAAAEPTLLRQALHTSGSLRGLNPHNVRHRYAAWEMARARVQSRVRERPWVLEHGISSASSSDDEDDAFEMSMMSSWDGILDAYEDEQMVGWDHWSGRKLQPDELDDEY